MKEQIIKLSEGCPYGCSFCFNGKVNFKEFPIPQIVSNHVILHDDAFLSKKDACSVISHLGSLIYNKKSITYEILQGINKKDLTQDIAHALYQNRFKKIRFAWDGSYSRKNMYKVLDCVKMLTKAGYKKRDLMCFILSNYYVSLPENMCKLDSLKVRNIPVCNCRYRKNYLDPKIYPEHWNKKEIEYFTERCRTHNLLIKYNGYDPEIDKRLLRLKDLPLSTKRSKSK